MRFALAGAVALFDVFAGAAMFSGGPAAIPWSKVFFTAGAAFGVMSGGVLLGECFAVSRGYPSPFGAAPERWLKTHFMFAGMLMVAGILLAGFAGRRALIPVASAAFLMLISDGIMQRTDILEGLCLSLARGFVILAGALVHPENIYRLTQISFLKLPVLVMATVFMVSLLGRAFEPEPREARVAAMLSSGCILLIIALAAWQGRSTIWAIVVWLAVFGLATEQLITLWPAGIGKRRGIIRNLLLALPAGIEAASITALGPAWIIGGIILSLFAAAYFFAITLELETVHETVAFSRRRR